MIPPIFPAFFNFVYFRLIVCGGSTRCFVSAIEAINTSGLRILYLALMLLHVVSDSSTSNLFLFDIKNVLKRLFLCLCESRVFCQCHTLLLGDAFFSLSLISAAVLFFALNLIICGRLKQLW